MKALNERHSRKDTLHAPDIKKLKEKKWFSNRESCIPPDLLRSDAYLKLSKVAMVWVQLLLQRRRMEKTRLPGEKKDTWVFVNTGLKFPHSEAYLYGFNSSSYKRSRDQAVQHGIIDYVKMGGQKRAEGKRECSEYDFILDWMKFGTSDFKPRNVPKKTCFPNGFKRVNQERQAKAKKSERIDSGVNHAFDTTV